MALSDDGLLRLMLQISKTGLYSVAISAIDMSLLFFGGRLYAVKDDF